MPGTGSGAAGRIFPTSQDMEAGLDAPVASGASRSGSTPTRLDLPLPAYAGIASLALRAADLAPAEPRPGERPFLGYDRERASYARLLPVLLNRAEGRYVVLVGDEIEGPVDTFEEALRAGWKRFGPGPLYVKQIAAEEPAGGATG